MDKKTISVVAAVIWRVTETGQKEIYATQRGYGELKGGWEFPGGKIEPGETHQQALRREIEEELHMEIHVGDYFYTVEYEYPTFYLSMDCFWCEIESGKPELVEHMAARWLNRQELDDVAWLPADITLIETIRKTL